MHTRYEYKQICAHNEYEKFEGKKPGQIRLRKTNWRRTESPNTIRL